MRALNIGFVAPELAPYWSWGGIGTGMRGLSNALLRRGHSITFMLAVPSIAGAKCVAEHCLVDCGAEEGITSVRVGEIVEPNGLRVLLFEIPVFDPSFGGYGADVSSDPLAARRASLFARAVMRQIELAWASRRIDVLHAHEWPTAMVPYLLRERGLPIASVFTIHNLAHQGIFPFSALACFELGQEHAVMDKLELYGRISLLKGGVLAADQVTTVSPTYAEEIQRPERGELLDGVLRYRSEALTGIVNGIDVSLWDPAADPALTKTFDASSLSGKQACKRAFCQQVGLGDGEKPLLVFLGRIVEQKGVDLLLDALDAIAQLGAQLLIAGSGHEALVRDVQSAGAKYAGCVRFLGHITDEDSRRLLAAADFVVMPSRWEPCGIVQLQAMRYGALPIVRRTGGLADTVIDWTDRPQSANGFVFDEASPNALIGAVKRALRQWGSDEAKLMQRRGMLALLGWEGPLSRYESVYRKAMRL